MQDEAGHLIGEYDGSGNLIEETVWLGDIPVATLRSNGSGGVNIFYVHTDHLNTPRKVAQPSSGTLAWRWDADPFGSAAPNQNPAGLGTFAYNLRFPGQYYDAETGLSQNWNRDYDPIVGRYTESDPIGLHAGVNTYAYVTGDPINDVDPLGLLNRGLHLTDQNWQNVQQAQNTVRQELSKSCSCHQTSSGDGCIPCEYLGRLLNRLETSTVSIDPNLPTNVCGDGSYFGGSIWLSPDAFTDKACHCLASVIYHELLHNIGLYHDSSASDPDTLESKCVGNLCKKGL
jgi:RHS repeat-associated protein